MSSDLPDFLTYICIQTNWTDIVLGGPAHKSSMSVTLLEDSLGVRQQGRNQQDYTPFILL